jgi:hypothetical protein
MHTGRMSYEFVYHGLISVPSEDASEPGIYWLRLLCENRRCVAIVTEVPLNPGFPMWINTRDIGPHIERLFSIDLADLTFYRVVPRGYLDPEAPFVAARDNGLISRDDLEASLGLQLPGLPENQELRRRVMELGGAETKYIRRQLFEAIHMTDLPPPHNPFSCEHRNRFNSIEKERGWADAHEVGRRFIASLTVDDINACRWHQANWAAVANESARIVEIVGRLKPPGDYIEEARHSNLHGEDLRWLASLFETPIIIGGGWYTDGQHRGCALRFSGAPRAAVVTGYGSVATRRNDWQYEGDG